MRELTGNWYIKKGWFGRKTIMVEVVGADYCKYDNSLDPEYRTYQEARPGDCIELNINII